MPISSLVGGLGVVEGEKKERERIYPRSPRVSLLPCVQALKTRTKSWVLKRGQRER
jgi:hypothetical protein